MAEILAFKPDRQPATARKRDLQRWLAAFEAMSPTNQKLMLKLAINVAKSDRQKRAQQQADAMKGGA